MSTNMPVQPTNRSSDVTSGVIRRMIQVVFTFLIQAACLFLSSGRLDWIWAWAWLGVGAGILVFNTLVVMPKNLEMVAERGRVKEDTKDWDKVMSLLGVVGQLSIWIVAGLDARWGWSPPLHWVVHVVALLLVTLGYLMFSWAMMSNKFFSGVVRIQKDRGHTVETGGPYRYVRHPGYVGWIVLCLATSLALGSLWALTPAVLSVVLTVVRTALEDRTLREELPGYEEYAQRVRYRLLPGVW
jgi:protein-S-isoprenylcysteine O-methyltransferase Ste14